jgi:hypothetical protein
MTYPLMEMDRRYALRFLSPPSDPLHYKFGKFPPSARQLPKLHFYEHFAHFTSSLNKLAAQITEFLNFVRSNRYGCAGGAPPLAGGSRPPGGITAVLLKAFSRCERCGCLFLTLARISRRIIRETPATAPSKIFLLRLAGLVT